MRLKEFEKSARDEFARYVTPIRDTAGAEDYELVLTGPEALLEEGFREAELEALVDPGVAFEQTEEPLLELKTRQLQAYSEVAALERPHELLKEPPPEPSVENCAFASLRRLRGEGTFWRLSFSSVGPFPTGFNIFFFYPPSCVCSMSVAPASGDQDLFLHRLFIFGGALVLRSSSQAPGTFFDAVSDSNPPLTPCNVFTAFIDRGRILWFSGGTAGTLTISAFSLP